MAIPVRKDVDGVHPVKIQYVFDPPLALPGPGKYAFYIQIQPDCSFPYIVGLLAATTDDYPGGGAVGAYGNKCDFGGRASYVDPLWDLAFDVESCRTHLTPVRRQSWGALKAIYR